MSHENPLNIDPRDVIMNDDGDAMPPIDVVFDPKLPNANSDNRLFLILDHPGMGFDEETVIRGINAATDIVEAVSTETPAPARAILGSRARNLAPGEVKAVSHRPIDITGNPEGRSPESLHAQNAMLEAAVKADYKKASAPKHPRNR